MDYKTNKPEKDGLFCERIFGPTKSGICACGIYRVIRAEKEDPKFCEECGMELDSNNRPCTIHEEFIKIEEVM